MCDMMQTFLVSSQHVWDFEPNSSLLVTNIN